MQKRLLKAEKIKQSEKFDQMQNLFLKVHPGDLAGKSIQFQRVLRRFWQTMDCR
jgi:hypothetical protein